MRSAAAALLAAAARASPARAQRACAAAAAMQLHPATPPTSGSGAHGGSSTPPLAARVAAVWDETPSVKGLRLEVDPGAFTFRAGQWVDFFVPGMKQVGGFSIVSTPAEAAASGAIELGVKATRHPVAEWVCAKAAPGAKVHVRVGGSFGLAPASLQPGAPSLFVAGGIGVTPIASMLGELVESWLAEDGSSSAEDDAVGGSRAGSGGSGAAAAQEWPAFGRPPAAPRAVLLYSARAPQEFALLRRLLGLQAASRGALRVRLHCSGYVPPAGGEAGAEAAAGEEISPEQAAAEEPGPRRPLPLLLPGGAQSLLRRRLVPADLRGAVGELLAAGGGGAQQGVTAYVCGPPGLADEVDGLLRGGAVPGVADVVMERWW